MEFLIREDNNFELAGLVQLRLAIHHGLAVMPLRSEVGFLPRLYRVF